jgi:SAM-dependent methyltransferase
MAVADVGAGTGVFVDFFARDVGRDGRVFAVEIAPKFVDLLRERAAARGFTQVHAVLCTERDVALAPASVDVVFACDTYHHFEYPQATLASIHRALRAGGTLVLVDFERIPGVSRPMDRRSRSLRQGAGGARGPGRRGSNWWRRCRWGCARTTSCASGRRTADAASAPRELRHDLVGFGKAAFAAALVPQQPAVGLDPEVTLAAGDRHDLQPRHCAFEGGGQTGRAGQVVSDDAVFDRHVHAASVAPAAGGPHASIGQKKGPGAGVAPEPMPKVPSRRKAGISSADE